LRPCSRTSFAHQPEAQHPKSSAIHKLAGRLPHLSGEERSCGGHRRMTEFETELQHCSLLSRIAYRNVAPLLREK
jgi:hypothetical protein